MFSCSTEPRPLALKPSPTSLPQPRSRLTHGGDGLEVGHKTKTVLEDSTAIEERDGKTYLLVQLITEPFPPKARILCMGI